MSINDTILRAAERGTRAARARTPEARALVRLIDRADELLHPTADPRAIRQQLAADLAGHRPSDPDTLAAAGRVTADLQLRNLARRAGTDPAAFDTLAEQAARDPVACRQWAPIAHKLGRGGIRPDVYAAWRGYQTRPHPASAAFNRMCALLQQIRL